MIKEVDYIRWRWMVCDERVSWPIDGIVDHSAIKKIIYEMVWEYSGWDLYTWLPMIMEIDFVGGLWVFCDERVVRLLDDVVNHVMVEIRIEVTWSIQSDLSHDSRSWHGYIRWILTFNERCLRLWLKDGWPSFHELICLITLTYRVTLC